MVTPSFLLLLSDLDLLHTTVHFNIPMVEDDHGRRRPWSEGGVCHTLVRVIQVAFGGTRVRPRGCHDPGTVTLNTIKVQRIILTLLQPLEGPASSIDNTSIQSVLLGKIKYITSNKKIQAAECDPD